MYLLHHRQSQGLQGNLEHPLSSLTLASAGLFLSNILILLSSHCCLVGFSPFSVTPEALASHGLVAVLEIAGIGFVEYGGSSLQLVTEVTLVVSPLPKFCHADLMQPHKIIQITICLTLDIAVLCGIRCTDLNLSSKQRLGNQN